MAKIIRLKDVEGQVYEPPLTGRRGIDMKFSKGMADLKERPHFTMSRVFIPPGARNQRHYHVKCDAGMHVLKGRLRVFFGPSHNQQEDIVEAGDFIYIPQGEIHGLINLSDSETVELVSCYGGVASWEEAQTVFIEPPWAK
jgi:quercetin dioxygenase-like cupin family protein